MDRRLPISQALDLMPGLLGIGVFAVWSKLEGGFEPTDWYPGTLFLLGALVATGWGLRTRIAGLPRLTQLAAGLLAGFTLWSYLSIAWADVPAQAWDGANRTLLYLIVFGLFALPRWRPGAAAVLFGIYAAGVGAVGAVTILELAGTSDPATMFINGRLIEPAGYQNAVAALLIGGAWPALLLSSRRETPWQLRGLLLAVAGLLVQLALLPQSRGAALVLPFALLLYFAIVPSRLRGLTAVLLVATVTLLTAPSLLDVYDAVRAGSAGGPALDQAAGAIGLGCLVLVVVGTGLALLDERLRLNAKARVIAGRAVLALGCLAALAALTAALVTIGNPIGWAGDRVDDFKGGYDDGFEANRFSGDLGSNRYDFWRVGMSTTFGDSPILGAGADNFATDYLLERRSGEEPRYPHSLPVRVLAGTGLVGALLLAGFLIAAVAGVTARIRAQRSGLGRAIGAASLVAVAYWFMHSSGDWLWSFPAVTAPAFAWLGMAGTIGTRKEASGTGASLEVGSRFRRGKLVVSAVALFLALAAGSLLAPWLSARYVTAATQSWIADPAGAYESLDRARWLNPLSAQPDLVGGAIAGRYEDLSEAQERFGAALEREPRNWYALLGLGVATALDGDRAEARTILARAEALNPLDPTIAQAARRLEANRIVTFSQIDQQLQGRVCERLGGAADPASCRG